MKLHFLGTSGYHPNETRHTACFMLPEAGVVLDAGTAMFRVRELIQTGTLSIFVSHAHLDHTIGLTYLFSVLAEAPPLRVAVYAEEDKLAAIRERLFSPPLFPLLPPLEFHPLHAGTPVELPDGPTIQPFALRHPGGCLGFRLNWPRASMAYVTDTEASRDADYLPHISGVDLLVHECYFPDGHNERARLTGHSCLGEVVELAAAANVGELALVHLNPLDPEGRALNVRRARQRFSRIHIPADRDVLEFGH